MGTKLAHSCQQCWGNRGSVFYAKKSRRYGRFFFTLIGESIGGCHLLPGSTWLRAYGPAHHKKWMHQGAYALPQVEGVGSRG